MVSSWKLKVPFHPGTGQVFTCLFVLMRTERRIASNSYLIVWFNGQLTIFGWLCLAVAEAEPEFLSRC